MKTKISPFAGTRVELSPSLDLWMRGARYGTIRNVTRTAERTIATVAIDHPQVKRLQKIDVTNLSARLVRPIGPKEHLFGFSGFHVQICDLREDRACVCRYAASPIEERLWIYPDDLERES